MIYTTNLQLKKPAYTDPADIVDINDNMDKLDAVITTCNKIHEATTYGYGLILGISGFTFKQGTLVKFICPDISSFNSSSTVSIMANQGMPSNEVFYKQIRQPDGVTTVKYSDLEQGSVYEIYWDTTGFFVLRPSGGTLKITGQEEVTGIYKETIAKLDLVKCSTQLSKSTNPVTNPAGPGRGVSFSADGVYSAVANDYSPSLTIYKRSGDTFTKLANPTTLPPANANAVSFSPDGIYLAVAHSSAPYVTIYKRSGDTFTKLANPSVLPTGGGSAVAFSPNGTYLAVGHNASPFITIYKRSGDTFTKLANPTTLPDNSILGLAFSPDNTYLGMALSASPYACVYKRASNVFTLLGAVRPQPLSTGYDVAFSPDNTQMVVAHAYSPFVSVYKRNADDFARLADTAQTTLTGIGQGVDFSADGCYMAVSHYVSPFLTVFYRSGDVFTKLPNPSTLPPAIGMGIAISPISNHIVLGVNTSPNIHIYKYDVLISKSNGRIADLVTATGAGYATQPGVLNDTKPIIKLWR